MLIRHALLGLSRLDIGRELLLPRREQLREEEEEEEQQEERDPIVSQSG